MFDSSETSLGPEYEGDVQNEDEVLVRLNADDYRAQHIVSILKAGKGFQFKGGIVDVGMTNDGQILDIDYDVQIIEASNRDKRIAKAAAKAKANHKSVFSKQNRDLPFMTLSLGKKSLLKSVDVAPVDLILACPRPLRFERLVPVISSMGIGSLTVVGAEKVEKGFFGSHLFRKPGLMSDCIEEGLSQGCHDYNAPVVTVERALHTFLRDTERLDRIYPRDKYCRIIAHPPTPADLNSAVDSTRMMKVPPPAATVTSGVPPKVVVAIGPEGGWTDGELKLFLANGFLPVHLGERVLRTDVATPALLALAHEWVALHTR